MSIPKFLLDNPEAVAAYERAIAQANEVTAGIQPGLREFPSTDIRLAHPNARIDEATDMPQGGESTSTVSAEDLPEEVVNGTMTAQEWAAEQANALRNPAVRREELKAQGRILARHALNSLNR
jgi:hypothetical protein